MGAWTKRQDSNGAKMIKPRPGLGVDGSYHSPQLDVAIRLNTNESPFGPSAELLSGWCEEVSRLSLNRYPDRSASRLRAVIASYHGVEPESVFVANGSNEVIQTILLTYGGEGRRSASFEPTYAMYETISRTTGTRYIAFERDNNFLIDSALAISEFEQNSIDVGFICSPNNPTGLLEDLELAVKLSNDRLIVVDEAYGQFNEVDSVQFAKGHPEIVVLRTFSKIWSMAGLRVGYAIGDPEVIANLWSVCLPYHFDSSKAKLAELAFGYVGEMEARVGFLRSERDRIMDFFETVPVTYWRSSSNFILFRPDNLDGHRLWEMLLERSILLRDWSRWPRLDNCLRVTVGSADENDIFMEALGDIL